jgi:superfamily II DNA or RNA helicase
MYLNEAKLEFLRNDILVEMPYLKDAKLTLNWIEVDYDKEIFRRIYKDRWNVFEDRPVKDVAELFRLMRRVVNSDPSRLDMVRDLMKIHPRLIIFYNYNFELEILRTLYDEIEVGEWNGHQKDPLPESDRWVYLVQYVAGGEGWNCTSTDAMILYSLTYSYKNFIQAQGRIDRLDTKFETLYIYTFLSNSKIDLAIKDALSNKKAFNKKRFLGDVGRLVEI